ncbi:MAG: hypothetical protein LBU73_08080 [Helicobacteraceae bacterium]|nr:hypothetical protein [Helicobacteraceae bacterium]
MSGFGFTLFITSNYYNHINKTAMKNEEKERLKMNTESAEGKMQNMWIHFNKSSYGSYGGGLNEPFRYFGRILSDKFQTENIEFPYGEIEICLTFLSPKDDQKHIDWFNKLPYYYRGKTMVRVVLPMVEEEKNLTDVFQLIYKAFDIIISKKKKSDIYDAEKLKSTLILLEKELQTTDLRELNSKYENLLRQEAIERHIRERIIREQTNDEKKRLIYDLRFYYSLPNTEKLYFSPYDNRFCGRILEKLREKKFRLPNYTHLYIIVSDAFENALYEAVRAENWFVYGIAVLENYADYPAKEEIEKQRIVFDLIKQGLYDIAKIDKLDIKILNEALDEVEQKLFKSNAKIIQMKPQ